MKLATSTGLLAALCWAAVPSDAQAGWRARERAFQEQAAAEQERRDAARGTKPVDPEPPAPARPVLVLSETQIEAAVDPGAVSGAQLEWLKPRASALPPNPHATTDFTAYTLQFGEVKVGLLSVGAGVLPHVQVTTMPALDYLGLPNVQAKLHAVHLGPIDLAFTGQRTWISQETFRAGLTGFGALASLRIARPWSVHGGASYTGLTARGVPDLCSLSPLLTDACAGAGVSTATPVEGGGNLFGIDGNDLYGEMVSVRVATDVRFNRRDSLILQASAVPFARVRLADHVDVPDIAQLDEVLSFDGKVPLTAFYTLSGAWQMAWKNVHLRVGLGTSTLPLAWLTQTTELSVHFGGKDAIERTKQRMAWRRNRRDAERGLDVCQADPAR